MASVNKNPLKKEGKGCSKSEGGSGCIVKRRGGWVILNNKKGGVWKKCKSKEHCESILDAYHANKSPMKRKDPPESTIQSLKSAHTFKPKPKKTGATNPQEKFTYKTLKGNNPIRPKTIREGKAKLSKEK